MSQTRLQVLQNTAKTQKFVTVIGHGSLINAKDSTFNIHGSTGFKVPEGMSVIFISKPGYHLALRELHDLKMASLLQSLTKLRQFINDKLPEHEVPNIIKKSRWNWKEHIYTSGMNCPNMGLELYDYRLTPVGWWYNAQCGVWYPGTTRGPEYKGKKGTLKNLISSLHTKGIVVVFGCRGDPETSENTTRRFEKRGEFGGQDYRIIRTNLIKNIESVERGAARLLSTKRVREPALTLKKRSVNRAAKRRRISKK
jgi:hypothetical protein